MSYQSLTNSLYDPSSSSTFVTTGGNLTITETTQSVSKDTGALIVEGGVGIEKNLYVGGNIVATGTNAATTTDALESATTTVNTSSATAPTTGQVLTATSSTAATWQTPSSSAVAVGAIGWGANLVNASGSSVGGSSTVAGADLRFFRLDVSGNIANGSSPGTGTYRNQTGISVPSTNSGYFRRES